MASLEVLITLAFKKMVESFVQTGLISVFQLVFQKLAVVYFEALTISVFQKLVVVYLEVFKKMVVAFVEIGFIYPFQKSAVVYLEDEFI